MSNKVSKYMMLAFIDSEIMRLEKSKEESIAFQDKHPWEFDDAKLRMTIKTIEILLAIRALILAVEEWKDGAKEIKDVIYEGEDWDIASSLIREIRDFGEEGENENKACSFWRDKYNFIR